MAVTLPAAFAQILVEEPSITTEDAVEEDPVEEATVKETPVEETPVVDEEEVEDIFEAAVELDAAAELIEEVDAESQKEKEEQERKEALEKAAEEAAAKATEETVASPVDDEDDGSNVKAGISALHQSVATKMTQMAERVKGIAVTKQKVKKAAAATLGMWGAATGVGWAMHHFGAEKAAA